MGQAQINVRTRACSRTSIARTRQAALTPNVRGKELTTGNNISVTTYLKIALPCPHLHGIGLIHMLPKTYTNFRGVIFLV